MKRIRKFLALFIIASILFTQQSCIGSFQLTNSLYSWNKNDIGGKWGQALVFFALVVIPVYQIALFADGVVLNTIEFWSGGNPLSMAPGEIETKIVKNGDDVYKFTVEANLLQVEKLSGVNAGESGEFVYDQVDDAWSYFGSEGEFKLKR
ncbi:MAG: DUF3332 family protein [Bacteroidales bacterium]|jgi:hypothetical protein|nr:DUF3332 family protein [Bacteroidales bacterium]MDI9593433.1 DUF3332 family protein [Bacteroidota bacterium]OQC36776.1 MAG: hypothetical protein BWX63_01635 [Bacteroidetes bacterium ADurb.Bin041]HNV50511.1 DUF3332 family protein [Bacteroidales bacterium]HNY59981.1 DUF3332 family protein [Bacteroidales bacterium]